MNLLRFLKKSAGIALSSSLILSSIPIRAADDDWLRRNASQQQSTYQQPAYQPSYTPVKINIPDPYKPPQQFDVYKTPTGPLDTESRGIIQAQNAMKPAQVPDSFFNSQNKPVAPKPDTTPVLFQFSAIKTSPLQDVRQLLLKDAAASAPKPGFFESIGKAFHALGEAFAGAGRKIYQVFQKVVQLFRRPSTGPSPLAQKLSEQYSNLKEITPGTFQTLPEGQTFAHGKAWESGSTFKATADGVQLIEGVTMDHSVGGLSRSDGMSLPIRMRGKEDGGVEPLGIDFSRMEAGTSLKAATPIEFPTIGSINAAQITYTGQKNGNPILEVQGRGSLSVEGISDMKVMKQAEQQLSMKLRLMNGSFEVKDAVLTVGGTKTYLDAQGKGTPVSAIESGVQGITDLATPLLSDAKKQTTSAEQNARAVNALLKNLFNQTGHELTVPLHATDEAAKQKSAVEGFSQRAAKAQANVQGENYGDAIAALPALKEEGSSLQKSQAQVTQKVEALKGFNKTLRGLTGDFAELSPKIGQRAFSDHQALRKDVMDDRIARFFTLEKGTFAEDTSKTLASLTALAESGQVDPTAAKSWGKALITIRAQVMGAVIDDKIWPVLEGDVIEKGMDFAFFNRMDALSKTHPKVTECIGVAGQAAMETVQLVSQAAGLGSLAAYVVVAPVVTVGSMTVGWGAKKGMEAIGVEEGTAKLFGEAMAAWAPEVLSELPIQGSLLEIAAKVKASALTWATGEGFFPRMIRSTAGWVLTASPNASAAEVPTQVELTDARVPISARATEQLETQTPNFYARSNGEIVPATGYRHIRSDAAYLPELLKTGVVPANPKGTYFTFDRLDDVSTSAGKLQVFHDAAIRLEFDTKQVLDDVAIPHGDFGKAAHLEPHTADFKKWGSGGATQAVTCEPIQVRRIVDLRTGKVLYERK